MDYKELKHIFRNLKQTSPEKDLTAHITFTEDSFVSQYSLLSRTYRFGSDNKAFWPNMGGYSIFAYCLDKASDQGVRLDWYMAEEGNVNGWKVEDCYILEQMQDVSAIPDVAAATQDDGTVCYFFGNTTIRVRETMESGKIKLEPVAGDQIACGEWVDLPIDRVYGYCTLLERHLNETEGRLTAAQQYPKFDGEQPECIKIYWQDLTQTKQDEILQIFGENGNWDVFPIATIDVPTKDGATTGQRPCQPCPQ